MATLTAVDTAEVRADGGTREAVPTAIVGCGAVAELLHVPAALSSRAVRLAALVDTTPGRAASLATIAGVPSAGCSLDELPPAIALAIVALPNAHHLPVVQQLLARGIHVLVEKPMGRTVRECASMVDAAQGTGLLLSVAHVRRHFPAFRLVKTLLDAGVLGTLRRIDVREGAPYRWPVLSKQPFDRDAAGGGVLIDVGTHVFDLLRWWGGEWEVLDYADDAQGGVEADCTARLRSAHGVDATVELSRTRLLRNTIQLVGERATLEVGLEYDAAVDLRTGAGPLSLRGAAHSESPPPPLREGAWRMVAAFVAQLDQTVSAIHDRTAAFTTAEDGLDAVALVERCYASRTAIIDPFPVRHRRSAQ